MAAFENCFFHVRQIAEHRNAGFCFDGRSVGLIEHFAAIVKNHAADSAWLAELGDAFDDGGERQGRAFGTQDKKGRDIQQAGNMPGAGFTGRSCPSVVISHHSLADCSSVAFAGRREDTFQGFFACQEIVQIVALDAHDGAVEHRVDIIRATLKSAWAVAFALEKGEQAAGDGCFPAV